MKSHIPDFWDNVIDNIALTLGVILQVLLQGFFSALFFGNDVLNEPELPRPLDIN